MGWITTHRIEHLSDGESVLIVLRCVGCKPEHRINYKVPIPDPFERVHLARRRNTRIRDKHVQIMADAGCQAARDDLAVLQQACKSSEGT